jgi:hypothetical protein
LVSRVSLAYRIGSIVPRHGRTSRSHVSGITLCYSHRSDFRVCNDTTSGNFNSRLTPYPAVTIGDSLAVDVQLTSGSGVQLMQDPQIVTTLLNTKDSYVVIPLIKNPDMAVAVSLWMHLAQ